MIIISVKYKMPENWEVSQKLGDRYQNWKDQILCPEEFYVEQRRHQFESPKQTN